MNKKKKEYKRKPKLKGVAKRIKDKPAKIRQKEKAKAYEGLKTPIKFSYNGINIMIKTTFRNNDLLGMYVEAEKDGKKLELDNPFLFKNPPVLIPDGTYRKKKIKRGKKKEETDIPNYKCDLDKCIKEFVGQAIKTQIK